MLAYICIHTHTHTSSCRRESDDDKHIHIHTPMPTLNLTCVQAHTHILLRAAYSTSRSASITHIQVGVNWRVGWWWHTHTQTHTHTQAYACGVTFNLRTYFTSVRRVFLVETVVLQTALWDILAWSARFLVIFFDILKTKERVRFKLYYQANYWLIWSRWYKNCMPDLHVSP